MRYRGALLAVLAACGRVGFEPAAEQVDPSVLADDPDTSYGIESGICDGGAAGISISALAPSLQLVPGELPRLAWTGTDLGVVWRANNTTLGGYDLAFGRLDAESRPRAGVHMLTVDGLASEPRMAWSGSTYGIVWSEYRNAAHAGYFLALDSDGAPLGEPVVLVTGSLATTNTPTSFRIVAFHDHFVVGWEVQRDLHTASITFDGQLLAGPTNFFAGTSGGNIDSDVEIVRAGGGIGAVWTYGCCDGREEIYAAIGDASGNRVGPSIRVDGTSANMPYAAWSGTELGIVWSDYPGVEFAVLDASGALGVATPHDLRTPKGLLWNGTTYGVVMAWPALAIIELARTGEVVDSTVVHSIADTDPDVLWTTNGYAAAWDDAGTIYVARVCK